MKTFGIGLALLAGGFALYLLQANFAAFIKGLDIGEAGVMISENFSWLAIGVMVLGIVWYWIVSPLLYFMGSGQRKD